MNHMLKTKRSSKGFSIVILLVLFVVVAVIGIGGYYLWHKNHDKTTNDNAVTGRQTLKTTTPATTFKTYTNDEYKFSFQYPSTWKLTTDLEDIGRGYNEGDVIVESPYGTKVHFGPNLGGKGGGCGDDSNEDTTLCSTRTVLSLEALSSSPEEAFYFYHFSLTAAKSNGGGTIYYVGIENGSSAPTETGSVTGDYFDSHTTIDIAKIGNVTVYIEGEDDNKNDSPAFFDTREIKEATPILKSFKLLE
jgi:hypothetical protein